MALVSASILPHPPIVIPEVGAGREAKAVSTVNALQEVANRIAQAKPDTVVIVSPHQVPYAELFAIYPDAGWSADLADFGVPGLSITADTDVPLAEDIIHQANLLKIPAGFVDVEDVRVDHGSFVPLYFAARAGLATEGIDRNDLAFSPKLIILSISGLSAQQHFLYGQAIARSLSQTEDRVAFIASGDLSHTMLQTGPYGFHPAGPEFAFAFDNIINAGDLSGFVKLPAETDRAAAVCGLQSCQILAGLCSDKEYTAEILSHEAPFGVDYAVVDIQFK